MAYGVQVDATGVRVGASGVIIADAGTPCCCASPPETCTTCVNPRYRIVGYADGDFTPASGNCAAAYAHFGSLSCSGVASPPLIWDGTFQTPIKAVDGLGRTICTWQTFCNNGSSGTLSNERLCISGVLVSGSLNIQRVCTPGSPSSSLKTLFIIYHTAAFGNAFLWQGTAATTDPEMATVYTRTGGDSAGPATVTLEAY